jgi:hypothetical protein
MARMKKWECLAGWRNLFHPGTPECLAHDKKIREAVKPGLYMYFESSRDKPKRYRVFHVLPRIQALNGQDIYFVECAALFGPHSGRRVLWPLLGLEGFLTPIEREDYTGPRFVRVRTKKNQ